MTVGLRESQQYLHDHQAELMSGAGKAVRTREDAVVVMTWSGG